MIKSIELEFRQSAAMPRPGHHVRCRAQPPPNTRNRRRPGPRWCQLSGAALVLLLSVSVSVSVSVSKQEVLMRVMYSSLSSSEL